MLVAALIVELAYEPPPAAAATITIPALKDNTLYNDGVEESNGAGSYMFAGRTKDGFLRRAVAAFDVAAAVPAGSTITNATLTLNLSRSNQASTETVTMQRLDASWGEGTSSADKQEGKGAPATAGDATWTYRFFSTTPWTTPGGDFSTTISASAAVGSSNGPYSWSSPQLTADVQSMLDNPSTNHGWIVIGNETTNGTAKRFDTRENNTASARPGLSIEYVPPLNTPTPTDTPAFSPTPTLTPTVTSTPTATVTPTATPTSAFTTPLYSPPVLTDANINISIEEACIQILPGPCTNMWTYGGTFPGPTIRRPTGQTTNVTFTNNLPVEAGAVSVHNHGNHSSPVHDGRPNDFLIGPGESRTYVYEHIEDRGNERGTTQFYHDHVMDLTARNVWYGLAGFYIIDDSADPSTLPSGAFDIPLAIADRQFDAQNQIPYTFLSSGVTGDHFLVNGVYQPYLDVGDRQYRFRILNASNARTYNLALSSAQSFTQVGTESGLLPSPVARMDMRIGTGERTDVVIDFAGLLGQDVFLVDTLTGTSLLKFRVTEDLVDDSFVPATLRPLPDIGEPEVTRTFNFGSTAGHWTINGLRFDPNRYDAQPVLGTTEKWVFQNLGSVAHTIHLHDVDQICMSRDDGPCLPYEPMKDTWFLGPNEKLEVKLKFTDHTGPYVFHCHILEHEDDGMMAQFEVITPMSTATPPPSTTPTATSTATATPTSTATNTPPATDTATATSTQASPTVTSTATATPTEIATASPSPIRSLTATATAVATDSDGDGCDDVVELGPDHVLGGQRDPFNFWDFYDVTGDSSIDLTDTLAILGHFGHGPSDDTFDQLADRFIPNVAEPWRTGESNDGLDLTDALNSLASFGDSCGV